MARFYARFDHGTISTLEQNAPTKGFDRRKIAETSASAALLRSGLIASRSALSVDFVNEIDAINRDGSLGTYFPPDLITTDGSTFISGSIYTSSVDGIRTPITNTYDVGQAINYSTRPTASILSSQTTLVQPTNPPDSASAAYSTYVAATDAVSTVLNAIRSGSDNSTNRGPFARLGNTPLRTLHSLWNDPDLQYFAWDDFTPGTGSLGTPSITPSIGTAPYTFVTSSTVVEVSVNWNTEYAADKLGTANLSLTLKDPNGTTLTSISPSGVSAAGGYGWVINTPNSFNLMTGSEGRLASLDSDIAFSDVTIPTNNGPTNPQTISNFARIVRMTTLTQRVSASLTSNGTCFPVNVPIYGTWEAGSGGFPGDNPIGNNTSFIPSIYKSLDNGSGQPEGFDPTGIVTGYAGGNYWLVQSFASPAVGNDVICEYTSAGVLVGCDTDPQNTCGGEPVCSGTCVGSDPFGCIGNGCICQASICVHNSAAD
jgi:hypothetical protein